jgi:hypothetical protein
MIPKIGKIGKSPGLQLGWVWDTSAFAIGFCVFPWTLDIDLGFLMIWIAFGR